MTTEQWRQVREVFEAALEREPAEREPFLSSACRGDGAVLAEVRRLLIASQQSPNFLEHPLMIGTSVGEGGGEGRAVIGRRIGPYQVLREIGRGGMGVVYLATRADDEYQKQVAIKLVWPGLDGQEVVRRFRRERQILADLDHPHIARLLDGGTTEEGWPYVVMEYVAGVPITDYCDGRRLPVSERLKLFRTVCAAAHYAHQHRVIHRDLKPSNVLVTEDGVVKLLDFGIAKLLDPEIQAAPPDRTRTGLHLMTPEYASPEQVRGEAITIASDVYSLGVVLYELLTGRRPHRFQSPLLYEVVRAVCEEEPERPSAAVGRVETEGGPEAAARTPEAVSLVREGRPEKLRARLAGDLDNVVMMALSKDPARRYPSVEQLSEDLGRHLAGEPVVARRPTVAYRAGKLVRRHRAAAGALLLALLAVLMVLRWQVRAARERAHSQRQSHYAAMIRQVDAGWAMGRLTTYREALESCMPRAGAEDLRGFEWYYLWRLGRRESLTLRYPAAVSSLDFINGGAAVLADYADKTCKLWETATGRELASWQGNYVYPWFLPAYGGGELDSVGLIERPNTVKVWEIKTGRLLHSFNDPTGTIRELRPLPDRRKMVTGHDDGAVKFWDLETGQPYRTLRGLPGPVMFLYVSPDGKRMLTNVADSHVQLWDLDAGRVLATYPEVVYSGLRFTPDGRWFWTLVAGRQVTLRESATGRTLGTIQESADKVFAAESLDDRYFYTGMESGLVKVYEIPTLRLFRSFQAHPAPIAGARLSPDGRLLATIDYGNEFKLWDRATLRELAVLVRTAAGFGRAQFSPDGSKVLAGNSDGAVQVCEVAALINTGVLRGGQGKIFSVAFSPDGGRLATAGFDGTVKLWDTRTEEWRQTLTGHHDQVLCVAFSPDGRRLASSSSDRTVRVWDARTGRSLLELNHPLQIHSVAFSPDGKLLATGCDDKLVRLWEAATGREVSSLAGHSEPVWTVAFSPDGRTLASGSVDKSVRLWEVATGRELATLAGHSDWVWSAVFSPDGKWLATGSTDRTARLWDLATRQEVRTFAGHTDEVFEVALSPDGRRLATASNDNTVKLWDTASGQELLTLKGHTDQVWSVTFSPDGRTLASGSWDGTARLWRTATDRPPPPEPNRE